MKNFILKRVARFLARPAVAEYLIERSQRTPYLNLEGYMNRWWLFNPYHPTPGLRQFKWCPFSIRVHHILRADNAEHQHDHPWDARTFILKGGYIEKRGDEEFCRFSGDTATVLFNEYHHISHVTPNGAFTLFITWKYRGVWGFKVDGKKVPWKQYVAEHPERS